MVRNDVRSIMIFTGQRVIDRFTAWRWRVFFLPLVSGFLDAGQSFADDAEQVSANKIMLRRVPVSNDIKTHGQ